MAASLSATTMDQPDFRGDVHAAALQKSKATAQADPGLPGMVADDFGLALLTAVEELAQAWRGCLLAKDDDPRGVRTRAPRLRAFIPGRGTRPEARCDPRAQV
jgi:hypothetical protein